MRDAKRNGAVKRRFEGAAKAPIHTAFEAMTDAAIAGVVEALIESAITLRLRP